MLEELLKKGKIPSPIIIECSNRADLIQKISFYALCLEKRACGNCRGCKQIKSGFHPDLFKFDGSIKMEELREALYKFRQRPFEGGYRVFIIDEFQETSTAVQNALLKTLEEPLPHWVLVLGTNSRFAVLPTIRSRCLLYTSRLQASGATLNDEELEVFRLIETKSEFHLAPHLDGILKDRAKAKNSFQRLLQHASQKKYPGHWASVAPWMEGAVEKLDRNLNARLIWDDLWAKSFAEL